MFILSHSAAKIVPSANLLSAHLSADLFQHLCIITQDKSAAMSEVTQSLCQSREEDANEGEAVSNHGARWLTYKSAERGAARGSQSSWPSWHESSYQLINYNETWW